MTEEVPAVAIVAGSRVTCAITMRGVLKCWGANDYGQLGVGVSGGSGTAIDVPNLTSGVAAVSVGSTHICALTISGEVKCWGSNHNGKLGNAEATGEDGPVDVSALTGGVMAIAAGGEHTCAVTAAGGVECWGSNRWGQLGNGLIGDSSAPVAVPGLTRGISAIAAGYDHTCVLTDGGAVKCWGSNRESQLGNGTTIDSRVPVDVPGLARGITAISAGDGHACALTVQGGVKCWGRNHDGQLGNGTKVDSSVPVDVRGLASGVTAISAGGAHTCVLMSGGSSECWGFNGFGQLGNGTGWDTNTPVQVTGLPNAVTAISAGGGHTCALTRGGRVWCWGSDIYGESGPGDPGGWEAPRAVPGFNVAISVVPAPASSPSRETGMAPPDGP